MHALAIPIARIWNASRSWVRRLDYGLIALIVAFVLVAPIGRPANALLSLAAKSLQPSLFEVYDAALREAAIKRPDFKVELATIAPDVSAVDVVSFGRSSKPDPVNRKYPMWVALLTQLKAACAGKLDPVLALEQILGLPPSALGGRVVNEFNVQRKDLYRPCVGGGDLAMPTCSLDPIAAPDAPRASPAPDQDFDARVLAERQMWNAYRYGFPREVGSPTDYPFNGYPFTGMGWSYNWDPASTNHVGVSEFVVPGSAEIKWVGASSPSDFCAKAE